MTPRRGPTARVGERGHLRALDQIMRDRGLETQAVADDLGVGRSTITRWRHLQNDAKLGEAIKLADYLGVTLDELAGRGVKADPLDDVPEIR